MSCNKCNKTKCGCGDRFIETPTNFSNNPEACPPNSEKCSEVFDMACICYNGADIKEYDIKKGDRLDEVLQKLILAVTSPSCATWDDNTTCQSITSIQIEDITDTSITLIWDEVPAATGYSIEFRDINSTSWTLVPTVSAPASSAQLTGLIPDTVYEIRINTICSTGTCYSLTYLFKTLNQ